MKIKNEVLEILNQCDVSGDILFLPDIQLDRTLYTAVNKVLESIGGKWNRKSKGHVFSKDISSLLEDIILTGEFTDIKKEFNFFPTPIVLGKRLIELADIKKHDVLMEPSAGQGAIADLFPKDNIKIIIELNEENAGVLIAKGYYPIIADFLKVYYTASKIIMNPPFTRQQDIDHILHAYKSLNEGGTLVSVCSTSPFFRDNKKSVEFRSFLESTNAEIYDLDEGTFKESGTMVNTKIVKINK